MKYLVGFLLIIFVFAIIIRNNSSEDNNNESESFIEMDASDVQKPEITEYDVEHPSRSPYYDTIAIEMPKRIKQVPEQIIIRYAYTTSYNQETKCPNWVAWQLSSEHTDGPYSRNGVPYYDDKAYAIGISSFTVDVVCGDYFIDNDVTGPRQEHVDWKEHPRGIDHGHMCPAADCCWDKIAMNQSFLLTNMCPQNHDLNGGDWAKLESKCRTWAKHYGQIYIVAGPIFDGNNQQTFGVHKIPIPDAFFKVVLCLQGKPKAIGFFYNNDSSNQPMRNQVRSVDEIESITGFDFFSSLPDELEDAIEALPDFGEWR